MGRRLDYWTIAVSSCLMSRCLYPQTPRLLTAAQTAIIPFCPLPVTCLNIGVAEVCPCIGVSGDFSGFEEDRVVSIPYSDWRNGRGLPMSCKEWGRRRQRIC